MELMISPSSGSFEYVLADSKKDRVAKGAETTQRKFVEVR